ncbi:MAG: L,D-transpeptidase [Chthoniobacterales bacterium]
MHFVTAAGLIATLLLAGCAGENPNTIYSGRNQYGAPVEVVDNVSYWNGGEGAPSIIINLTEQRAYFYKGDQLAGVALIATGKEGYDTPSGKFRVMEKIPDKVSDLYGWMYDASGNVVNYDADIREDAVPPGGRFEGASMPYWMRLTGAGVGMHQGVIPVPGSPASHGCIRMSKLVAAEFFANAKVGMPVRVVY